MEHLRWDEMYVAEWRGWHLCWGPDDARVGLKGDYAHEDLWAWEARQSRYGKACVWVNTEGTVVVPMGVGPVVTRRWLVDEMLLIWKGARAGLGEDGGRGHLASAQANGGSGG